MNEIEKASALFLEGFSCSQAVFAAYAIPLGIRVEQALKIADGFGGGFGRQGMTCGALAGAAMALGLACGREKADDFESKRKIVKAVREITALFKDRFGSTECRELLGFDLKDEELVSGAHGDDSRFARCADFVRFAAESLSLILPRPPGSGL